MTGYRTAKEQLHRMEQRLLELSEQFKHEPDLDRRRVISANYVDLHARWKAAKGLGGRHLEVVSTANDPTGQRLLPDPNEPGP